MAQQDDQAGQWMQQAAAGNGDAFALLAEALQDRLFRFALAQGLQWADAAEAVQETLLRAYGARGRWRAGASPCGWFYGIEMNVVREMRRTLRRAAGDNLTGRNASPQPSLLDGPGQDSGGEEAGRTADADVLAESMALLPQRQREALACRFLRRMTVRQTAETMNCAEGTVKASVFAALRNLRKRMGTRVDHEQP